MKLLFQCASILMLLCSAALVPHATVTHSVKLLWQTVFLIALVNDFPNRSCEFELFLLVNLVLFGPLVFITSYVHAVVFSGF